MNDTKALSSGELIRLLKRDGWQLKQVNGDHYQFVHPVKMGKLTVPHPNKDLPKPLVRAVLKQAGLL